VGSKVRYREVTSLPTLTGATVTLTNFLPATVWVWGVVIEVLEQITGTLTTFDVGTVADPNLWGSGILLVPQTRTTSDDYTAVGAMGFFNLTALDIQLDADGANAFAGGSIRVTAMLSDITANIRRGQFA
jgi:hypothetical protein